MCQWFAPTKLIVTFERDGIGKFSDDDLDRYVLKNSKGETVGLDFPTKFVLIANHQVSDRMGLVRPFLMLLVPQRFMPTGGTRGVFFIS